MKAIKNKRDRPTDSVLGKALVNKLWPLLYKRAELELRLKNINSET